MRAVNIPSRQHKLNDEYYDRVEAIQFTMRHDDGNDVKDIVESYKGNVWLERSKSLGGLEVNVLLPMSKN